MNTVNEEVFPKKKRKYNLVLVLVLLLFLVTISSVFLGTLSKYMTTESVSDDASVAKFGLNVPKTIDLFAESYTNGEAINVSSDEEGKKIIAPGTSGYYEFEVSGTAEVAYQVSATIEVLYSVEWEGYEPIQFSLDGSDYTTLEAFETNLAEELSSDVKGPNQPYKSKQTIFWKWPFSVTDDTDILDTKMGQKAATDTAPTVNVELTVTAVQAE